MKPQYAFLGIICTFFAVIAMIYLLRISLINLTPIAIMIVIIIAGIFGVRYLMDSGRLKSHNQMTPFEALEFVKEEWEKMFNEKVTMTDSMVSPFYIPGDSTLFYAIRIQRNDGSLVPIVVRVPDKYLYYELYPSPLQIDNPARIIVPDDISISPIEKMTPQAMKDYWRRKSYTPAQVYNIGQTQKRDDMDKLRQTREEKKEEEENG